MWAGHHLVVASQKAGERDDEASTLARDGMVQVGSYDPATGRVDAVESRTFGVFAGDGNTPLPHRFLPILTGALGIMYGAVGDEIVDLIPLESGFGVLFEHDNANASGFVPQDDDGAFTPSGELWFCHRDPATKAWTTSFKFTNDGAESGDGKSGVQVRVGGFGSIATSGGHVDTWNDTTGQITRTSKDGHSLTIDDKAAQITTQTALGLKHQLDDTLQKIKTLAGQAQTIHDAIAHTIDHLVPAGGGVGLGAAFAALAASRAVPVKDDLLTISTNIRSASFQSFLTQFVAAMTTAAAGNPPTSVFIANLTAIISAAGWITNNVNLPTIPTCSSKARADA